MQILQNKKIIHRLTEFIMEIGNH